VVAAGEYLVSPAPRVHLLTVSDKVDVALIFWLTRHAELPLIEERMRRVALRRLQELIIQLTPPPPRPA